ncbi:hypothetical protein LTR37_015110 [Vermiconidia calcicola]|uniref:Uncharacterized protein n=1 Tax=Vermiconidia calcicola TaxID=1690605 RepID=A0ACC3MRS0_9PEZI|nr:hypothetical protein LTR37_015110 [Vermiconidia calcicola]
MSALSKEDRAGMQDAWALLKKARAFNFRQQENVIFNNSSSNNFIEVFRAPEEALTLVFTLMAYPAGIVWVLFTLCIICSGSTPGFTLHEKREVPLTHFDERQRIGRDVLLPMRIGLKQNENSIANAESWLIPVSDPDSINYGRFWAQNDIVEAFQPSDESFTAVARWLSDYGILKFTHSDNKLWLAFDAPAAQMEQMFRTKYYVHSPSGDSFAAACDEYYLPDDIRQHVDYITPGIKATDITKRLADSQVRRDACKCFAKAASALATLMKVTPRS